MRESTTDSDRRIAFVIYVLFFLSGAAALVYEISWARQIGIFFGHTVHAAAVVLSGFFGGMAVGYLIASRFASRVRPLRSYGVAELAAAIWAVCLPWCFQQLELLRLPLLSGDASLARELTRAILIFGLLLPATAPLGATLPLIAAHFSKERRRATTKVTLVYAMNTLGAVVGVVASSFFLIPGFGVAASSYLAAGVAAICGLIAFQLGSRSGDTSQADVGSRSSALASESSNKITKGVGSARSRESSADDASEALRSTTDESDESALSSDSLSSDVGVSPSLGWWMGVAAISGLGTLALQVLYTRMFSLIFHNSTYTFGAVVAVFLAALAIGSLLSAGFSRLVSAQWLVAIGCGGGGIAILFSVGVFLRQTELEYFDWGTHFLHYVAGAHLLVAMVIVLPVVLLGMVLPAAWRGAVGCQSSLSTSQVVGRFTAVNTLAAAGGSLLASFVMLPTLGLWNGLLAIALLNVLVSLLVFLRRSQVTSGIVVAVAGCLGLVVAVPVMQREIEQVEKTMYGNHAERIAHWEGAYGWVDVVRYNAGTHREYLSLKQNVRYELGSDGANAWREYRQCHLPLLLHPDPKEIALLGLGTGLTAAPVVTCDRVESAVIVELIPEVVQAARLFERTNLGVLDSRKVSLHLDDARHYLLHTPREFDVIISDLFVPWESETGYLYTVEHYQAARQRLRRGGIFCQWLPLYQVGEREFELIADSFATEFPHVSLWWGRLSSTTPMLALLGSETPLQLDRETLTDRLEALDQATARGDSRYFKSVASLLRLYVGHWPHRPGKLLNRDETPRVEFLTPISVRNHQMLRRQRLLEYHDQVLSQLPQVRFLSEDQAAPTQEERHRWHRRSFANF